MSATYDGLKFVCVVPNTSSSSNKRAKELAESSVRSHAAIITHRKKRATHRKRVTLVAGRRLKPLESPHSGWTEDSENSQGSPNDVPSHLPTTICETIADILFRLRSDRLLGLGLLAPNTLAVHKVFRVSVFWNDCWLRCMSNETFCNAFLARVQACRNAFVGLTSQPTTSVLRQERRAIQGLQRAVDGHTETDIDEQSLLAMIQLGLLEVLRQLPLP